MEEYFKLSFGRTSKFLDPICKHCPMKFCSLYSGSWVECKYHASNLGENIYEGIDPIPCTRMELDSTMQSISKTWHLNYITGLNEYHIMRLMKTHDEKTRSFSEVEIAALLYNNYVYKYVAVYDGGRHTLWYFHDGRWVETSMSVIWMDLSTTIVEYVTNFQLDDIARYLGSVGTRERIQRDLVHRLIDNKFISKLNTKRNLIGVEDGVLDLDIGKVREAYPHDYISMSTHINMRQGREDRLLEILSNIFPDPDVLEYFIRSCATLLEGTNKDKRIYVWWGKGNNGKSIVEKLLSKALGDYAGVAPTSLITGKRSSADNASPQLSCLEGKLAVFLQEPNPDESIRIGMAKELSGGDAITARALYKSPRIFVPKFKLIVVCNGPLKIPSVDIAFKSRLVVIPFISTFYTKTKYKALRKIGPYDFPMDTNMSQEIEEYADIFLNMLVNVYMNMDDIPEPDAVTQATQEYIEKHNTPLAFLREHIRDDEDGETPLDYIYREYKIWMLDNSNRKPEDFDTMREQVAALGYTIVNRVVKKVVLIGF